MTKSLSEQAITLLVPTALVILCALSIVGFGQGETQISGMALGGVVLVRILYG
jgi:hypothetical protein